MAQHTQTQLSQYVVDPLNRSLWSNALGNAAETTDIAEQHRHFGILPSKQILVRSKLFGDAR